MSDPDDKQGNEPDWTEFDESYLWTPENPMPTELFERVVHDRWVALPKIENVAAPSLSELAEGDDISDYLLPVSCPTFTYDPGVPAFFEEGVTTGTLVLWDGTPGPAQSQQVVVLADGEGNAYVEPTGEWQDVNVVNDGDDPDA